MTYFYILPALLFGGALLFVLSSQAFHHFVDLSSLKRFLVLLAALWISGGWLQESWIGAEAADRARWCMEFAEHEITRYQRLVQEILQ